MSVMMVAVLGAMSVMVVQVIGALDVAAARHHENMPVRAHHLDVGAVKLRQDWCGHDVIDTPEHGLPVAEIKHPVERTQQLVKLVRAKQHGDLSLAADLVNDVD